MTNIPHQNARQLFVFDCLNLQQISHRLGVSPRMVGRWKSDAKDNGDCWNTARSNVLVAGGDKPLAALLHEFITMFNATLAQVKSDASLTALEKITAISSLGDAYTKVIKSAGKSDPQKAQLAIALDVVQFLIEYLSAENDMTAISAITPHLEKFGQAYKKRINK